MLDYIDTAKRAVALAVHCSMKHFRHGVRVETKPDRSPVTAADKESEAAIVALLTERHPDHAILGEESGAHAGKSARMRWIIDPLDGTRGFSRGGSFWGPLVALEEDGVIVCGAMALPVLGEMYWAGKGTGTHLVKIDAEGKETAPAQRVTVSALSDWQEATLSLGELQRMMTGAHKEQIASLAGRAAQASCFGDLAACAMLFTGRAEAWIETGVQIWDLSALKILVEEAGGRFTDLEGKDTHTSGHALATNGVFHDEILAALR